MKKNLRIFKSMLVLSLMMLVLFGASDFAFTEANVDHSVESIMVELDLLKQENMKIRDELMKFKTKVQGKASKIPVLMYHHILTEKQIRDNGWTSNHSILSLESFKSQMDYLYENDFYTLTIAELEEYIYKGKDFPKKSVLITFDDGYLSNAEYAYPIMKEYGFKGTIFMIGKNSEVEPSEFSPNKLMFLPNKEIHKYIDVFEYECHTYSMHARVDGKSLLMSNPMDKVEEDLKKNRELYDTSAIAYPHGGYNQDLIDLLIKEDYKLGFAGGPGYVNKKSNAFELQRFGIYPYTSMERFKNIVNVK